MKRAISMRRCSSVRFAFAIRPWWTSSSYRIAALVSSEAAGTPTPPRSVFPSTSLLVIQVYLKHSQTLLVTPNPSAWDCPKAFTSCWTTQVLSALGSLSCLLNTETDALETCSRFVQVQTAQDRQSIRSITEFCFEWRLRRTVLSRIPCPPWALWPTSLFRIPTLQVFVLHRLWARSTNWWSHRPASWGQRKGDEN